MAPTRTFASDNNSGVHPDVLDALSAVNEGHVHAYGEDPWTEEAIGVLRRHFGSHAEVFFVFNGTGANVSALSAMVGPGQAVVCATSAHINNDEGGAPERISGAKLIAVPTEHGKLAPADIKPLLVWTGDEHHAQPRVVSIAQSTELGTVYTAGEIGDMADFCHSRRMLLHMDGARLCNAAASLRVSLAAVSADAGVDILSFGATKNGAMLAEAVVVFGPGLADNFKYVRKSSAQLASKMRYVSTQFTALFGQDLWLDLAKNANSMARLLSEGAKAAGITLTQPTQANEVFALLPSEKVEALQEVADFYVWEARPEGRPGMTEVRWVASWDTTKDDVERFVAALGSVGSTPGLTRADVEGGEAR